VNELALFAGEIMNWKSSEYARNKAKAWRLANPEKVAEYRAKNRRKSYLQESYRKYGITEEQYKTLMESQNNSCATCKKLFDWDDKQTKPHIDHCHETKKVRGILCNKCNTTLGLLDENMQTLLNLARYLECHG
jgi:hypothetical protein